MYFPDTKNNYLTAFFSELTNSPTFCTESCPYFSTISTIALPATMPPQYDPIFAACSVSEMPKSANAGTLQLFFISPKKLSRSDEELHFVGDETQHRNP